MNNSTKPVELATHPLVIWIPVQWGDHDAFDHVNNVVYFRWMESLRIEYFRQGGLDDVMSKAGVDLILASVKCDFRKQLTYPDTVLISASIASIGRTSMKMVHLIYSSRKKDVVAEGDSTIVMFDYQAQQPTLVPADIRAKIDTLEGRSGQAAT